MLNPAEFLRMLRAAIRSECGAGAEPFVRSVVRRAAARGGGAIAFDEESARTLARMGLIEAGWEESDAAGADPGGGARDGATAPVAAAGGTGAAEGRTGGAAGTGGAAVARTGNPTRTGRAAGAGRAGKEPAPAAARAPGAVRKPGQAGGQASREAAFRAFIQVVARATGEDPLAITLMLRVFSSGIYGIVAEPLCGEIPRCDRCPFSASCRFVLTRGRGLLPDGRATSAALLTGNPRDIADGDLIAFLLDGRDADSRSTAVVESFLKRVGSFHALVSEALAGRRPDLAGLDADRAARLACAVEIVRRYAEGPRRSGKAFRSAADFYEHFRLRLRDRKQEVFCVAMLDQKLRLIDDQEISAGTLTTTVVHPREVFAPAIQRRAASVALIHNHPSGDPTPSGEDRAITRRLLEAAEITGIGLLDHVIVGDGCFFSFVEKQLL